MDNQPVAQPLNPTPPSTKFLYMLPLGFVIFLVGVIGGYFLGGYKTTQQPPSPVSQTVTNTPSLPVQQSTWQELSYEFQPSNEFSIQYPPDMRVWIFDGTKSGMPVSVLDQLFSKAISFTTPTNTSKLYEFAVGISDVDPTQCYQTTCKDALETITNTTSQTVSGITGKKVIGTAQRGGGILMSSAPPITLVIIPYKNKFVVLYSKDTPDEIFNQVISTFKLQTT